MPSFPLGPGVSRVLSAIAQQFTTVVWQADRPPLDSELNLMSQVGTEALAQAVRSQVHSGFFLDPTRCEADYQTDPLNVNQFVLSPPAVVDSVTERAPNLYASVNGWVLPIAGTYMPEAAGPDTPASRIRLYPPPTTDSRTDFVFLEVWQALVSANPSTTNKPSASEVYKYGNTQYGGTNLPDEIEDPAVGFETTKRVQIQYRFRVVGSGDSGGVSVDLVNYPDGLTDPNVLGQGTAASPIGGVTFSNMRSELNDPSLWRAGNGDPNNALGTVDGYVYAVPVCAVFRRNTAAFTAIASGGLPNQNGATERTPSTHGLADPLTGARLLGQATLFAALTDTFSGYVRLNNYSDSGLDDPNLFPVGVIRRYLVIGEGLDREIVSINLNTDPGGLGLDSVYIEAGVGRGRGGTMPKSHPAGTAVSLYSVRSDGLYSDQVAPTDILDMRRSINFGDWDYSRLLQKGVASVVQNNLRTAFKLSGTGGDTLGVSTTEVSFFQQPTSAVHLNAVDEVDGTDGIRTVWSDSAAVQGEVTVILDNDAALDGSNYTATTFDAAIASSWSMGADFQPNGFLNFTTTQGWCNGSVVFIDIGGRTGSEGARLGLLNGQESVRFIAPYESWKPGDNDLGSHHPWLLRFVGGSAGNSATGPTPDSNAYRAGFMTTPNGQDTLASPYDPNHPGPMFPVASTNFERPFIVLGGVLNPVLRYTGVTADLTNLIPVSVSKAEVNISAINWDTYDEATILLGRGQKTLREYLTDDGRDFTGMSSKLYLVIYGDASSRDNNGAFQVIGAGTATAQGTDPFTQNVSSVATHLVVRPLSGDYSAFTVTGNAVTIEFRSQEINEEDDNGSNNVPHGVAVVLTDLASSGGLPWGSVSAPLQTSGAPARLIPVASKATLTMDLLWSPSHGASHRVPDRVTRFGVQNPPAAFVRSPVSVSDPVFVSDTAYPDGDVVYPTTQVQLWNRLPSRGLLPPFASGYGGVVVGNTEQDREAELFLDPGSKTVLFRPFSLKSAILKQFNEVDPHPGPTLLGSVNYPVTIPFPKDGNSLFTSGLTGAFAIPPEFMPRFGRQDIPFHISTGVSDPLYPGVNHLFADGPDATGSVFYIIGGVDNAGPGNSVKSILFDTTLTYGQNGTVGGAPHTAYGSRLVVDTSVVSSDLGTGLVGVELPPYLGIARLYGVYERADFIAHADGVNVGGFLNTNRTQPIVGTGGTPPTNLLRTDASKQTLFIRQGGANAYTEQSDSHTYVVPSDAVDITRIPGYVSGQDFQDFDYVVECVVFGFAEGFINKNNYVLARRHSGTAALTLDASSLELTNVSMVLPSPAPPSVNPYEVYNRTVYQGDPYMTRGGAGAQPADYATRYGQIPQVDAAQLGTSIDQSGVDFPNPRAFEVLATMDFYTTLGTGKIGGVMFSDTILDCGYTAPNDTGTRIPSSISALPWRVLPRAFTAGQNANQTHGSASIQILDQSVALTNSLRVLLDGFPGGPLFLTAGVDFTGLTNALMAINLAAAINSSWDTWVTARVDGNAVDLTAKAPGALGSGMTLSVVFANTIGGNIAATAAVWSGGSLPQTKVRFLGGVDEPVNGGNGNSIVSITGMTERLPLGILASDSDFVSENILGDGATSLRSYQGGLRAVYQNVPLTSNGFEYTRFLGEPGTELAMTDGSILQYVPYNPPTPGGTRKYRLYRGGGASFVLSGVAPGGPVTWVGDSFSASVQPVLKGSVLACKAVLVRNYPEDAFSTIRSEGDEIQMVIFTQALYGTTTTTEDGITLRGLISPTGYGEGYAAADRYRLPGLPMDRGRTRTTRDPAITPAPYNGTP
jgi:hypothetical protein